MTQYERFIELKEKCEDNVEKCPAFYAKAHKEIVKKLEEMTIEEAENER